MFGILRKRPPAAPPPSMIALDQRPPTLDVWPLRDTSTPSVGDEVLSARVAEGVAWCDALTSLSDLRSDALRPNLFHDGPNDLVCDLGHSRQRELRYRKQQVRYDAPIVATGRFMLYFPDENLSDGYAAEVSDGFFDVQNLPAYDTWVSFFVEKSHTRPSARRYLLCYVPAAMVEAANAGIEGNPESCIVWLEQSDVSVRPRVEALVGHVRSMNTRPPA